MRRFYALALLLLVTLSGCSKSEELQFEYNDVLSEDSITTSRIIFSSESGDTITLSIAMMDSWHMQVEYESTECGFSISTTSGAGDRYVSSEFTSNQSNDTQYVNILGTVNIISDVSGEVLYSISAQQSGKSAAQTTLSYFTGTSLNSYFKTNISDAKEAIESGILGKNGRYLYLLPSSSTAAALYEVILVSGVSKEVLIKEYSSFKSLDVGSMSSVIEDVKSFVNFDEQIDGEPQRMNLVISGHGTGWIPYTAGVLSSAAGGYVNEWEPVDPLVPTRYMGASSDGYMEISELEAELEATAVQFGYILFDECFTSSVELLYRIRNYTNYVIASPCEVMAAGFPYSKVMPYMFTEDGSNYDLRGICEAYHEYYTTATYPYGCVAVCVTNELEALSEAQRDLNLRDLATYEVYTLQAYEGRTNDHVFFDLKQYVNLAADAADEELLEAYNTQFNKAFPEIYRLSTDSFYTNIGTSRGETLISYYSGVTTSAPTSSKYSSSLEDEPWTIATTAIE